MSITGLDRLSFNDLPIGRKRSFECTITAAGVETFAHLWGVLNPLHMDDAFAASTPFKQRVVHGLLTAALDLAAHAQLTRPGFVDVGHELRFA